MVSRCDLRLGKECTIEAKAEIQVPDRELMSKVLQHHGYSGKIGIELLHEYYGTAVGCPESVFVAYFGLHYDSPRKLVSRRCLVWKHFFRKEEMHGGDLPKVADHTNYSTFQRLGPRTEVDLIGSIGYRSLQPKLTSETLLCPDAEDYMGLCDLGWLRIDAVDFSYLRLYASLEDLLWDKASTEIETYW